MKLFACPRCREVDTDNEDHPTGIKLCARCNEQLAERLNAERAGDAELAHRLATEQQEMDDNLDEHRAGLAEIERLDDLYQAWRGDW